MATYKIYPLKCGEFQQHEKSTVLYLQGFGEKLVTPIIAYLIVGEGRNILVDTGCSDPAWAAKHHHPIVQTDDMLLLNGIKKHGLDPADITCVVNTHLHWDHCWNNRLFPGKDIYVQKRELEFAADPIPMQYPYYESEAIGLEPPFRRTMDQYKVVEGDVNLFPGIDLVFLPSHTPGFQGVLVDTEAGKYLVASDCLGSFKNWEGDERHRHIPTAIHVDLYQCYATYDKIERICDFILPGHDARVFEQEVYPKID
jgi:glyoxylase-like metal-dependent hydrolase (beta-lactamase superfamily II)